MENISILFLTNAIITLFSSLTALIIGITNFKSAPAYLKPLLLYLAIVVPIEIWSAIHIIFRENNMYLFRIFTILEFTLLSLFYYRFFKAYFNSNFFYVVLPVFYAIAFFDYQKNGWDKLDDLSISVESVVFICYSLFLYYYVLKNLLFNNLLNSSVFWINTGILLYFSGNLVLFVFSNYLLVSNNSVHNILWSTIHTFFNLTYNILLSIGFWKARNI
jgi:hypothetical protein